MPQVQSSGSPPAAMLDSLPKLEERFREIGSVARQIRQDLDCQSDVRQKSRTGDAMVDVVTVADYELQKLYLELFLKTELRHCRLLAEESSSELDGLAKEFTGRNGLTLCLDPVDGTARYVEGSPYYSSIVSVRDERQPLYSWMYYPALDWSVCCRDDVVEYSRPPHEFCQMVVEQAGQQDNTVVFTAGHPQMDCPDWMASLAGRGLAFKKSRDVGPFGAKFLLLSRVAGGYFVARPNPFDGLFAYHFARNSGLEIWGELPSQGFQTHQDEKGLYYPFRYLVLGSKD